ncbi:MAG TPA: C25 family cysteine peptidase [Blastocatellia bacterium]|nr:C25 family cysteine peptidase [Blastocatellia bacterium]
MGQGLPNPNVCWAIATDDQPQTLLTFNLVTGQVNVVGSTGTGQNNTDGIESLAYERSNGNLYAVNTTTLSGEGTTDFNPGRLGTLNKTTGAWSAVSNNTMGQANQGPCDDPVNFDRVDGLATDPRTAGANLWAVRHVSQNGGCGGNRDRLFRINPTTGQHVNNAFGGGNDYVEIGRGGDGVFDHIEDIVMDIDGTLYAVTNASEVGESELITINTSNGVATELCNFGSLTDVEGITIANDGTMYISTGNSSSNPNRIYRVDNRNTCQVTLLSNINFGSHIDIEDIACPVFPTTAPMEEATATQYGDRVLLEWRTGYEVDTLGFRIYREDDGVRRRLNESLIAGSVLLAGPRIGLTAGRKYIWWDELPRQTGPPRYWIEEIDVSGQRTLHGPIVPTVGLGPPRKVASTPVLSRLGRSLASVRTSEPSGTRAGPLDMFSPPGVSGARSRRTSNIPAESLSAQWRLAAGAAIKIEVAEPGWYRISQPELLAAGLNPQTDPRNLRLYVEGREVAIRVLGQEDGRLDPTDALEFYGVGQDTPWTDRRVYWLVADGEAGSRMTVSSFTGGLPSIVDGFRYTVERKERTVYFANLKNGEADNFFGPAIEAEPVVITLRVDHRSQALPQQALLEVSLQGVTEVEHRVQIALNGTPVGEAVLSGQQATTVSIAVPQSRLREGDNTVVLTRQGGENDITVLDVVRLTYTRAYMADGDRLWLTAPAGREITIGGFAHSEITVVDVTVPEAPQILPGHVRRAGGEYAVTASVPWGSGQPRTLFAFTRSTVLSPRAIAANTPSNWNDSRHRADIVMIAHGAFIPALTPLVALRQSQGYAVAVVDVEDIFDEFAFGARSPWAIRSFLTWARARWATPPRFVLLVGDASFDPRNYLGLGDFDYVPTKLVATTFLETASDDWFVDFDGDDVADIPIGRLPVRTEAEVETVVAKLVAYERNLADADWRRSVLLVADANEGYDFEAASERLRSLLPEQVRVETIYRGQTSAAREKLLEALARGQWLINYMGHGSVELWRGGVLTSADAETLTNAPRFPLVVAMTCLNGMFHDLYTESLAEALVKSSRGGAIAVWASSGLTFPDDQARLNRALIGALFDETLATVGEAVLRAKMGSEVQDLRRSWILVGDPATRLR